MLGATPLVTKKLNKSKINRLKGLFVNTIGKHHSTDQKIKTINIFFLSSDDIKINNSSMEYLGLK